jgi:hypothetical protein
MCFLSRFLNTSDARSTRNLRHHAKLCWGDEAVEAADGICNIKAVCTALQNMKTINGSIIAAFQWVGEGRVTYSHRQHTKTEARCAALVFVCQISEGFLSALNLSAGS